MRALVRAVVGLTVTACAACGSSGGGTALPNLPTPTARNVSGEWVQVGGGSRNWSLSQTLLSVGGPATFAETNHSTLGTVSGRGGLFGATTFFGTFQFAETYEGVTSSSRQGCSLETNGELTISGNRMTGSYTESIGGCTNGSNVRTTRNLVMERR